MRRSPARFVSRDRFGVASELSFVLQRALGTRVRLIPKPRTNKGRIEIEYYTLPDLERIIQMITRKTVSP